MSENNPSRTEPEGKCRPRLRKGVRLKPEDATGTKQTLLFPEGFADLDEPSAAILNLCDGNRTVDQIVQELLREFDASQDEIASDVNQCLRSLRDMALIEW
ncbi:MAG TPA: pyrroloquinoline quinone biosynthesis peptide chaperone PqqD [Phycisphaerae bacterium]|nr:pyrroloquinoline quinone biosynthesis peptide chaperone PqqD [Phycisphaerae bacterium]